MKPDYDLKDTEPFDIDLGDNHWLKFASWHPDDLEANRQRYGVPLPNVEKYAATIQHLTPSGEICHGVITFDGEWQRKNTPASHVWQVESWEPLTLSPSVLCKSCGDHGFIRNGKWVRA